MVPPPRQTRVAGPALCGEAALPTLPLRPAVRAARARGGAVRQGFELKSSKGHAGEGRCWMFPEVSQSRDFLRV